MTTRLLGISTLVLTTLGAAGLSFAQAVPKGNYVFSEGGPGGATLASLTFADDGSATGTAAVQQGVNISMFTVQGAYTTNADNSKSLALNGTSLDALDADGNPLTFSETVLLIPRASTSFAALRTDPGQYAGELLPAVAALAPGSYQIGGKPNAPADTSVELVSVDTAGSISGQKVTNTFGMIVTKALSGSAVATPTGFQLLTVNVSYLDADGNTQTAMETYLALPTQKDTRMLQTGRGTPGVLTLSN